MVGGGGKAFEKGAAGWLAVDQGGGEMRKGPG